MEQYNCPKCSCGSLFEDGRKLVCLNCGASCTKSEASRARHTHSYETHTKPMVKTGNTSAGRRSPASSEYRYESGARRGSEENRKQKKGIGPGLIFLIIWILYSILSMVKD